MLVRRWIRALHGGQLIMLWLLGGAMCAGLWYHKSWRASISERLFVLNVDDVMRTGGWLKYIAQVESQRRYDAARGKAPFTPADSTGYLRA